MQHPDNIYHSLSLRSCVSTYTIIPPGLAKNSNRSLFLEWRSCTVCPRYNVVFGVHHIEPCYRRGVLYSSVAVIVARLEGLFYLFYHSKKLIIIKVFTYIITFINVATIMNFRSHTSVLPRFSKGQGAIWKGHFSAVNGPSKGHFSAVNGPSKGHFSAVNWRKRA